MQYLLISLLSLLNLLLVAHLLVGLKLLRWLRQQPLSPLGSTWSVSSIGHGLVTDLGQRVQEDQLSDDPAGLTTDEIEWARELGASTMDEMIDLVRKHEESLK